MTSPPETLLSAIHKHNATDALPQHASHPFSASAEASSAMLHEIVQTTSQISQSLNMFLATPMSNPKLVSLLRQHSMTASALHLSDQNVRQTIAALRARPAAGYGEDIPHARAARIEWCIARVRAWGTAAGMEAFEDAGRGGGVTLVLGGKVLVVDVDFAVTNAGVGAPRIAVAGVKTSYASANPAAAATTGGSAALDAFLARSVQAFCAEVQKDEEAMDPQEAARLGVRILDHLKYLVVLDNLAARATGGGLKWFMDVDDLSSTVQKFAKAEAEVVASSLSTPRAPLDVFLLRSHGLPLPYLASPSISFLIYLSPRAYLTLLRSTQTSGADPDSNDAPSIDVSSSSLQTYLSHHPPLLGAHVATLCVVPVPHPPIFPPSTMPPFLRPVFRLVQSGSDIDHELPQAPPSATLPENGEFTWILDFTEGNRHPGIVMSQSRMREIELIVNPLSGMDDMDSVNMLSFGTGSWVDLLLNPGSPASPERYTALVRSPSSSHPPLQLRLTAPEEPGFLLERVRVRSLKDIWGILEVVREQCWLNEVLNGCHWTTEGLLMDAEDDKEDAEVTEEDLQAVLDGSITPRKIPVNVYIPNDTTDALFDAADLDTMSVPQVPSRRPKIVMTSPERPPISGLVDIAVSYDESRPRGISVNVNGAMGVEVKQEVLEEICRRGGVLALPGRVWAAFSV